MSSSMYNKSGDGRPTIDRLSVEFSNDDITFWLLNVFFLFYSLEPDEMPNYVRTVSSLFAKVRIMQRVKCVPVLIPRLH